MEANTIVEIVNKLIGHIDTVAETHYDNDSNKNIDLYGNVIYELLRNFMDCLYETNMLSKDNYGSAKINKEKMLEHINLYFDEIKSILEEVED